MFASRFVFVINSFAFPKRVVHLSRGSSLESCKAVEQWIPKHDLYVEICHIQSPHILLQPLRTHRSQSLLWGPRLAKQPQIRKYWPSETFCFLPCLGLCKHIGWALQTLCKHYVWPNSHLENRLWFYPETFCFFICRIGSKALKVSAGGFVNLMFSKNMKSWIVCDIIVFLLFPDLQVLHSIEERRTRTHFLKDLLMQQTTSPTQFHHLAYDSWMAMRLVTGTCNPMQIIYFHMDIHAFEQKPLLCIRNI